MSATKTIKAAKKSKFKQLSQELEGLQLLGHVVRWNARSTQDHTHKKVVEALKEADLDESVARELLPRHAFSRASKRMAEERVIDSLKEDGDTITFQFTKKYLAASSKEQEWKYATETFITLNKITGKIECENKAMRDTAQAELDRCTEVRTTNDVTKIIQRLFDKEAFMVPVGDQGGVYFVPKEYTFFTAKIEAFLHNLGGEIYRFPVPAGTQLGNKAVQESMAAALEQIISAHEQAVAEFTINTRKETIENVAAKIKHTRTRIEAYAEYLLDKREELLKSVEKASVKLYNQIESISKQKEEMPAKQNGDGQHLFFGNSVTAVIRWLGKEGYSFEEARGLLKKHKVVAADTTIRAQIVAGKTGTRGAPAKLSKDQFKELLKEEE